MSIRSLERRFDRFRETGDPADLAWVFDETAAEILQVGSYLCRDRGAAEDLLQRTFVTAIESASTWDRSRRLMPWLLGILAHHAKQESRKAARSPDPERLSIREAEDPIEFASRREEASAAGQAIDELPDPVRSILVMRYRHGLEPADIALQMGMAPATVRSHLHRVERLRRRTAGAVAGVAAFGLDSASTLAEVRRVVVVRATTVGAEIAAAAAIDGRGARHARVRLLPTRNGIAWTAASLLVIAGLAFLFFPRDSHEVEGGDRSDSTPGRLTGALDAAPRAKAFASHAEASADPTAGGPGAPAAGSDPTTGSLDIRVLARDGSPMAAEPFSVYLRGGGGAFGWRFGRTDADGRARLGGLDPGVTSVRCGHGQGSDDFAVTAGLVTQAEIRLVRGIDVLGIVVDSAGSPVAGAEVRIEIVQNRDLFAMLPVARTNADGRFALEDVEPATTISARADGFAPSPCRQFFGGAGKTENVRLTLGSAGAALQGRVTDANGAPVPDAMIEVGNWWNDRPHRTLPDGAVEFGAFPLLAVTAHDGTFAMDGLPVGKTYVTVRARGQGSRREARELAAGLNQWSLALTPGTVLEGVVVTEAGAPVAGIDVWRSFEWGPLGSWRRVTDAEGRFRFDDLPSDQDGSLIAINSDGYAKIGIGGPSGPLDPVVRVVLKPRVFVRVRVVDERGSPIPGHMVFARPVSKRPGAKQSSTYSQRTDADGRASVEVDAPETYAVEVADPEGDVLQAIVRRRGVRHGSEELTLTVRDQDRPTAKIIGRIVSPAGPLSATARGWATRRVGLGGFNLSVDSTSGGFSSAKVQPGRYELTFYDPARKTIVPLADVRVDAGQTLDVGEIRVDSTGSALVSLHGADALVRAKSYLYAYGERGRSHARLEPDGTARFPSLLPGRYRIVVLAFPSVAQPLAGASAIVVVESGRETTVDLTPGPGHVRRIRVEGLATDDVPGTSIQLRAEGDDFALVDTQFGGVARDGLAELVSAFVPGRYVASVETADGRKASTTFEVRGDGEPPVIVTGFR